MLARKWLLATMSLIWCASCAPGDSQIRLEMEMGRVGEILESSGPNAALDYWRDSGLASDAGGLLETQLLVLIANVNKDGASQSKSDWTQRAKRLEDALLREPNAYQAYVVAAAYSEAGDDSRARRALNVACFEDNLDCHLGFLGSLESGVTDELFSYAIEQMQYLNTAVLLQKYFSDIRIDKAVVFAASVFDVDVGMEFERRAIDAGLNESIARKSFCDGHAFHLASRHYRDSIKNLPQGYCATES